MISRRSFALAATATAVLPAAALAQTAPTEIRIGIIGYSDASSLPLYAQAGGFYRKYGLNATMTPLNGGGAIIAAVAGGSLDLGFSNPLSAVQAIQRGIPISVLTFGALFDEKYRADAMLVKARGSKLKTGADLIGKTIAVTTVGSTTQMCAMAWIDKNGGDSKSVHFVEVPTSAMASALKAGRIDGAMLAEPGLTQGRADVEDLGNAFAAVAPRWSEASYVASKAWLAANADAAHRFVLAMNDAARWSNAHHADTAKILGPLANIDPATFEQMARTRYTDSINAEQLQPLLDVAVTYGQLKARVDAKTIVADAQPYWHGIR
jgi:NitT/TauT family transport system substrate-binding protein